MKNNYFVVGNEVFIKLSADRLDLWTAIDLEDFDKVNKFPRYWTSKTNKVSKTRYAVGNKNGRTHIYMHRLVCNLTNDCIGEPDHINRNGLDNRKSNLRVITDKIRSVQAFNRALQSNCSSGYHGISFMKRANKWRAYIKIDNRQIHLGLFRRKVDAIDARLKAEDSYVI